MEPIGGLMVVIWWDPKCGFELTIWVTSDTTGGDGVVKNMDPGTT